MNLLELIADSMLNILVFAWTIFVAWWLTGVFILEKRRSGVSILSKKGIACVLLWPLVLALDALGIYSE